MSTRKIVILDYGSQVTQLIARRSRELGVYSEIHPWNIPFDQLKALEPAALILSGGPASVLDPDSPKIDPRILELNLPLLGICFGMQALTVALGGEVARGANREYGPAELKFVAPSPLWSDISSPTQVWMSHGDTVTRLPEGFAVIGETKTIRVAAMADAERKIYGLQFHPEVRHSLDGQKMLANFLYQIAGLKPDWSPASFVRTTIERVREQVGDGEVICALSGGVDSTVVAALLRKAIGDRLHCVFVDNGLLRLDEAKTVTAALREYLGIDPVVVDAADVFLDRLKDVADPEQKRKIIGHTFIEIFEAEAKKFPRATFLAQGTLYPDVIESVSLKGPNAVIKSHHNVGGLPEKMKLKLVEPLRELFKDEVRKVGVELGVPDFLVWRHPFPGPGLAIRVLGVVDRDKLRTLREADKIVREELRSSGWERKIWQGFAVFLPLRAVGVMGDDRTYENVIALRCVDSADAMTADWSRLPYEILARISSRIINEVKGVNRVVYDISSKPPATIEWE